MAQDQPTAVGGDPVAKPRTRPTKTLPTERINFKRQLEILRAYGVAFNQSGKPVANKEVADIVKMAETTTSLANAFFTDTGLLQRSQDGGFVPAPDVVQFVNAFRWSPDTASQKIAPIIATTWFAQALMPLVSFRPVEENEAIETLALQASASPEYRNQLGMLVDYMEGAGLVQRDGSLIRARAGASTPPTPQPDTTAPVPKVDTPASRGSISTGFSRPSDGGVQFSVDVNVDMKEIATWSPERINAFFAGIAQVLAAKGGMEKKGVTE